MVFASRKGFLMAALTSGAVLFGAAQASANLTIAASYDTSITSLSNASQVESAINSVVSSYESLITNNVTVNITFSNMNGGLGQSGYYLYSINYATYLSALAAQPASAVRTTALSYLPSTSTNPVNGNTAMALNGNLVNALGIFSTSDSDNIGLNLSLINVSRTGADSNKYDLNAVVSHEIDEVLGFGSDLGGQYQSYIQPEDLYRYSAKGVRSYQTGNITPYFSIDGGKTNITNFNNDGFGDYGDWATGTSPQVQDAYGSPGVAVNIGTSEKTLLQAIGYNFSAQAVPEPISLTMLGLGAFALLRRKRN
jgi:hypothetical protein